MVSPIAWYHLDFNDIQSEDYIEVNKNDDHPDYNLTKLLYAFNKADTAELLAAIGLPDGKDRYENADYMATWPGAQPMALTEYDPDEFWFYESDVLNKAMAAALAENSTVVKDALEAYMHNNSNENNTGSRNGSVLCSESA